METIDLPHGTVSYRTAGPKDSTAPPVVFVHGFLVNATLWSKTADALAGAGIRSYAADWPLGSHRIALSATADQSPRGIARQILAFLQALELDDVTLVGNDTGGAICQFLLDTDASRIGRLVLTNCDAFSNFPPRALRRAVQGIPLPERDPGAAGADASRRRAALARGVRPARQPAARRRSDTGVGRTVPAGSPHSRGCRPLCSGGGSSRPRSRVQQSRRLRSAGAPCLGRRGPVLQTGICPPPTGRPCERPTRGDRRRSHLPAPRRAYATGGRDRLLLLFRLDRCGNARRVVSTGPTGAGALTRLRARSRAAPSAARHASPRHRRHARPGA